MLQTLLKLLIFSISGALAGLLVLLAALFSLDIEIFRGHIEREVSLAFGREVAFAGPIILEPSLTPRLVIKDLRIANPDWASRPSLAMIDTFKVKASLLPLFGGELNILALELHGVDLQLEHSAEGGNNYTFGDQQRPNALPAVEHLLLYDTQLAWIGAGGARRSHHVQQLTARKVPRQPVELDLQTTFGGLPASLSLRASPGGDNWPFGPWNTRAQAIVGDLSVEITGMVPEPAKWYRGDYQFVLQGDSLRKLKPLHDLDLPEPGPFQLGGNIRFNLDEYLEVSDLHGAAAGVEFGGTIRWELDKLERSVGAWQQLLESGEFELSVRAAEALWQQEITVNGQSVRLTFKEMEVISEPQSPLKIVAQAALDDTAVVVSLQAEPLATLVQNPAGPWQSLELNVLGDGLQVSVSGKVGRPLETRGFDIAYTLEGARFADLLGLPGDFRLQGHYRDQALRHIFEGLSARIADMDLAGSVKLHLAPGQALPQLAGGAGVDVPALMRHVEVDLKTTIPEQWLAEPITIAGRTLQVKASTLQARALPGQALKLSAGASLNGEPVQLNLQGETLAVLAERPFGPWRNLILEGQGADLRFALEGDIERPREARGMDIAFELEGTELDTLLPLVDMVLPIGGPYALGGRFTDTPAGALFDELQLRFGRSDISGRVHVFHGEERPRVEAELFSDRLYLMEFMPEQEAVVATNTDKRVIPDFTLPIERMREIDGELHFTGKQLGTAVGDLGAVSFSLSLENQALRLNEFRVRGSSGARIDAAATIDASQNPPPMSLQVSVRELNYGALVQQAGLAELVEGTVHLTLGLTAKGVSRYELLSTANGQFIVVGEQGRFGSRRLDLWGSDLVTTMLSPRWHQEDVTELNCVVADIDIAAGVATTDKLLIDTGRITIGATGTLNLKTEELNLVFAPRPKRASLVSLTSPAHVTGTLSAPEVSATVLPRRRTAVVGGGMLAGLLNPAYLVFTFSQIGTQDANPCVVAIEKAQAVKEAIRR
jgi:uncharacterized protein involved in outer membrane biogenesis